MKLSDQLDKMYLKVYLSAQRNNYKISNDSIKAILSRPEYVKWMLDLKSSIDEETLEQKKHYFSSFHILNMDEVIDEKDGAVKNALYLMQYFTENKEDKEVKDRTFINIGTKCVRDPDLFSSFLSSKTGYFNEWASFLEYTYDPKEFRIQYENVHSSFSWQEKRALFQCDPNLIEVYSDYASNLPVHKKSYLTSDYFYNLEHIKLAERKHSKDGITKEVVEEILSFVVKEGRKENRIHRMSLFPVLTQLEIDQQAISNPKDINILDYLNNIREEELSYLSQEADNENDIRESEAYCILSDRLESGNMSEPIDVIESNQVSQLFDLFSSADKITEEHSKKLGKKLLPNA